MRCINQLHLRRRLGAISPQAFQRRQNERLIRALGPLSVSFDLSRPLRVTDAAATDQVDVAIAHNAGANVLAIDRHESRFLISGGADSTVRLWDLERRSPSSPQATAH